MSAKNGDKKGFYDFIGVLNSTEQFPRAGHVTFVETLESIDGSKHQIKLYSEDFPTNYQKGDQIGITFGFASESKQGYNIHELLAVDVLNRKHNGCRVHAYDLTVA